MATPLKRDRQLSPASQVGVPGTTPVDTWSATGLTAASPARDLQAQLHRHWAPAAAAEVRWGRGRALAFIALTNGLFWLSLVWLVWALR